MWGKRRLGTFPCDGVSSHDRPTKGEMAPTRLRRAAARRAEDPVFWSGAVQLLKTVAAAVIAWLLATEVFDLPQSFLAPWSALLVVHATLYRTFSQGARQVAAAVLGVVLAWAVGNVLGLDATSVAVVLALGLLLGAHRAFGDEATAVAATALIVLTTGFSDDDNMLVFRLFDTAIGIVVGLVINLLVWPPLRRRTTIAAIDVIDDRLGALLRTSPPVSDAGTTGTWWTAGWNARGRSTTTSTVPGHWCGKPRRAPG